MAGNVFHDGIVEDWSDHRNTAEAKTFLLGTLFKTEKQAGVPEYLVLETKKHLLSGKLDVEKRNKINRLFFALFSFSESEHESVASAASWLLAAMGFLRVLTREPHCSTVRLPSIIDAVISKFVKPAKNKISQADEVLTKELKNPSEGEGTEVELASGDRLNASKGEEKKRNLRLGLTFVSLLDMSMNDE